MRTVAALALCCACGGSNPIEKVDAAVVADAPISIDAPADARAPTCAASTFASSSGLGALNTQGDETFLRLSADELTAYFARRDPDEVLFVATRPSTTAPFGTPVKLAVTGVGTFETTSPSVTADGLTIYFTSSGRADSLGQRDIYRATRVATSATFAGITHLAALSSTGTENDVYVLPDHSAVYFSSNRSGVSRIYRAARQGTGFEVPEEVFNTDPDGISRVVVAPDELTMLYSTAGMSDIHLSTRAATTISWLPGVALTAIDSTATDAPAWISNDLCRLYYFTNRSGDFDFRVAVRQPQ